MKREEEGGRKEKTRKEIKAGKERKEKRKLFLAPLLFTKEIVGFSVLKGCRKVNTRIIGS